MHGNTRFMRCSDETKDCSRKFYKAPGLDEVTDRTNHVPLCKECGDYMKPHAMFFDESYSEHYYRDQTTNNFAEDADALIVVGTALQTSGARRLVYRMLDKMKIPVIEINNNPCIEEGYSLTVTEKSEISLDQMFTELYRLESAPAGTVNKPAGQAKPKLLAPQPAPVVKAASPKGGSQSSIPKTNTAAKTGQKSTSPNPSTTATVKTTATTSAKSATTKK